MFLLIFLVLHTGENFMLALDKREFVYVFDYKIVQPSSNFELINFSVEYWADVGKLKELQAEANQHAVAKLKNFIHENNVSLVSVLTVMLTIILIIGSIFLCYYFKFCPYLYAKFLKFYRWAGRPKNKPNSHEIVKFENVPEHGNLVLPSRRPL